MTTGTFRLIEQAWHTADIAGPAALGYARLCLLDWLGVTVAGAGEPVVDVLVADCETIGAGHRLIGRRETASLRDAVLINGAAGHALDYDDGMGAMMGHPSVAILPSLILLAAGRGIAGERLSRAVVAGMEAAGRIGLMLGQEHYFRGFHGTGTVGAMGGALAAAYLLDLDAGRSSVALGLAATRAAGLKASFGTDGKPLHAAWAALIAHTAALWAEKGMSGAADIVGHAQGLSALADDFDAERGLAPLPAPLVQTVNFKYHAACAITHPAIDGVLAVRGRRQTGGDAVESVVLEVAEAADNICNIPAPSSGLELKFSLRGVTAMALAGLDTASPGSFGEAALADGQVRRLIANTDVRLDPALALGQTRVTLRFADGSTERAEGSLEQFERDPVVLGERLGAKFAALVGPVAGEEVARTLSTEILDTESGPDAGRILSHLQE
ncbi:MAG: MmgE/PrpD family protein [Novosphingobium sp.]|nr:MmgE/PrpD family protein [Novosphingobium sp.]